MRIAVGSKNPVKLKAVERIVKRIWPDAEIIAVETGSGVSAMPTTDDEAIAGATNRAKEALRAARADFGVGIEGGTAVTRYGMFLSGWAVVASKDGRLSLGSGGRLILPRVLMAKISQGEELGPAMDRIAGTSNIKQREGAIGLLTKNLVIREEALAIGVANAFAKFISPEYYNL
jgi:inosine/xanthosine triphosphatase